MDHNRTGDLAMDLAGIALRAGAVILEVRERGFTIAGKADSSPVTEADTRAEEVILSGLQTLAGDIPVVSEEAASSGMVPAASERFFLVDPLDGTREFVDARTEFTVNIALIEYGAPVAGVVFAPALGLLAVAGRGRAQEARLDAGAALSGAVWRPLRTRALPAEGAVALASRSHRDSQTDDFLSDNRVHEIRSAGSSIKFVVVARGEADLYPRFGRTMEWDTAAGHAILAAAGGAVVVADGSDLRYGKRVADYANPPFVAWGSRPARASF